VPKALVVQLYAFASHERNYAASRCDCAAHRFGHAADHPEREPVYPTDLTDAEWAEIAPLIPSPAWRLGRGGRPEEYCHRQLIDSISYLTDNGIKWRAMPADFPAWDDCYRFFRRWKTQRLLTVVHDRLRRACRERAGRAPEPTAAIIDSQSLRAAETVGRAERGYDGAKKIDGTKRHIAVDTIGLLLAVVVTAANIQDRDGAMPLLTRMAGLCLRIGKVWADSAYAGALIAWAKQHLDTNVEIVKRSDAQRGFVLLPRRWVVERTLAWLVRHRRLARDYERRHESHEELVRWAMTRLMTRRLARGTAPPAPPATPRT
jgi:transposase